MSNDIAALRRRLPADVEAIVSRQFREIQEAHKSVKGLPEAHPEKTDLPMAGLY